MMRKLFKGLVVLTLVGIMASGAFGYDLIDDDLQDDGALRLIPEYDGHVTLAPNAKGDVLIYPFYMAADGWETKIQVMNTSQAHSVVAKLVVRSFNHSQELLDFFIYLTPADVWTGTLRNENGSVRMQSCDDSTRNATGQWGNGTTVCLDRALIGATCATDSNAAGYVEIFEAWHSDPWWINSTWAGGAYTYPTFFPNPIQKTLLYNWFLDGPGHSSGPYANLTPADIILQLNGVNNEIEPANVLAGHSELINTFLDVRAPVQATVLEDYNVNDYLELGIETYFSHLFSTNSICEVEAALSKDNVSVPYYNIPANKQTYYWFTFPTKLSQAYAMNCTCPANSARSPYFGYDCDATSYGWRYFDMTEQSPSTPHPEFSPIPPGEANSFPYEVNLFGVTDVIYEEGWINFTFPHSTTCNPAEWITESYQRMRFSGAPVIPTTMFFDFYTDDNCPAGCTASNAISFMPVAYDQALVEYDVDGAGAVFGYVPIDHYHYEDN